MSKRLRRYRSDLPHSYALGVFPTLELLTHRPELATEVVVASTWERNEGIVRARRMCESHNIEVIVSDRTLARIAGRTQCWAAGVFRKWEEPLAADADHVVLVNPTDMGNLGAVVRTMLAFEVRDLALVRPACDAFDPRTVRASMGAIFQARVEYFDTFAAYAARFEHAAYPFVSAAGTPLPQAQFTRPFALIFGSEGEGLPEEFRRIGTPVSIPQSNAVDSLNVSTAAGIALYAATAQSG